MSDTVGRIKASIPGTAEYEQQHGVDEWSALAEQAKSYIPGTVAHERRVAGDPAYQATDATGQSVGPVLPHVGAVVPQMKHAAAAAQEYVASMLEGHQQHPRESNQGQQQEQQQQQKQEEEEQPDQQPPAASAGTTS
ncbi:hypothetical protein OEZ85_005813 [Tetradesmus obliquus]|uniref:Uncharacterized protein n=2 Tax=Tetradesmus obliquus TaxID=3088 RepID=A0A383WBI8_TETOB|nr:hypothetical protein OEZ85_005813 [Tetradesmus obliquus]|eukprot:jgi/Sobl393_1/2397/SZX74997.1